MLLQAHLNDKNNVYKQETSLQKPYFQEYHFFYITPPNNLRSKISTWILPKKCTLTNLTVHKFSTNSEILKVEFLINSVTRAGATKLKETFTFTSL